MAPQTAPDQDDLVVDTAALGFDDFASMVESDDVDATLNNIEMEMKETGFGQVEVTDFTDFNRSGRFIEKGSFEFTVEARYLHGGANIMQLVGKVGARNDNVVKIIVMGDRLKLSSYNKVAFSEFLIPTAGKTSIEDGKEIAFVFDLNILQKLAKNLAAGGIINFVYNANRRELSISEGSTNLILTTRPDVEFAEFHSQIDTPTLVGQFDPLELRQALKYLQIFSQRDDTQKQMGIVNVDGGIPSADKGRAYGGSHNGIAVYESKGLANIKRLRIPNPAIDPIQKIIARMHPESSHMFTAGKFIILRDQNLYLGFEHTEYSFPEVDRVLEQELTDKFSLTRANLLAALQKLSIVNSNIEATVRMTLTGIGTAANLKLEMPDNSGKISSDSIPVSRELKYEQDHVFEVHIAVLKRTLDHFKTENVILEPTAKSILVCDDAADYNATTVLTLITPEVLAIQAELKAQKQKAKAEATTGVTDEDVAEVADDGEDESDALLSAVED